MKPITLKDISINCYCDNAYRCLECNYKLKLKEEAIKWVKDERERLHGDLPYDKGDALERWKTRLNITEEDLK